MTRTTSPMSPDSRPVPRDHSDAPTRAASPSWVRLGLVGALGFVAGTMLFATPAEGEARRPKRPVRLRATA